MVGKGRLVLLTYQPDNPLIVQIDRKLFLEVDNPKAANAPDRDYRYRIINAGDSSDGAWAAELEEAAD